MTCRDISTGILKALRNDMDARELGNWKIQISSKDYGNNQHDRKQCTVILELDVCLLVYNPRIIANLSEKDADTVMSGRVFGCFPQKTSRFPTMSSSGSPQPAGSWEVSSKSLWRTVSLGSPGAEPGDTWWIPKVFL